MPPYTPIADDVTIPYLSTLAGTAQADFIALKRKINNLFYESGHYQPLYQQRINSGLIYTGFLPPGADEGIMYGFACHVTRNDVVAVGPSGNNVAAVGLQTSVIAGDGCNDPTMFIFGCALEAWTSPVNSQALLIGLESSIIAQYNDNNAGLVGFDIVYKNRPDAFTGPEIPVTATSDKQEGVPYIIKTIGTTDFTTLGSPNNTVGTVFRRNAAAAAGTGTFQASTVQGKGANKYNPLSRAMQITSQVPSGSGEFCGWHRGITFEANSISAAVINVGGVDKIIPGIVISMTNMGEPLNSAGANNPWIAYPHSSALALSEYMSITWDKDQNIRMYCDSFYKTFWFMATEGNQLTDVFKKFGWNYDLHQLVINSDFQGPPGAANDTILAIINGQNAYIHVTKV